MHRTRPQTSTGCEGATLKELAKSYNVGVATISRHPPQHFPETVWAHGGAALVDKHVAGVRMIPAKSTERP